MLKFLLFPFAALYNLITTLRNLMFDVQILKSTVFDIPTIVVGNLSVGGTGKTPHTEYLIALLKSQFNVAVLSRGYKRKTKGFILATNRSNAAEIGDEPAQIKQKFPRIEVAVDAHRVNGINELCRLRPNLDVILLDDAYQHRYVRANINILLTDYHHLYTDDYILPCGRLRESRRGSKRANIIIVTKCPAESNAASLKLIEYKINPLNYQSIYFSTFRYGNLNPINEFFEIKTSILNLDDNFISKNYVILLVTGIANANPLITHLEKFCTQIQHISFRDHHEFSQNDIERIQKEFNNIASENKIIVTTEKDAMRFSEWYQITKQNLNLPLYFLPIEVQFLNNGTESFNLQITDYVRINKRNR